MEIIDERETKNKTNKKDRKEQGEGRSSMILLGES